VQSKEVEMKTEENKVIAMNEEGMVSIPVKLDSLQMKNGERKGKEEKVIDTGASGEIKKSQRKEHKNSTFRRRERKGVGTSMAKMGEATACVGLKRTSTWEDMEVDTETAVKKVKKDEVQEDDQTSFAGLSGQPCGNQ
jgi:hypothetical protein